MLGRELLDAVPNFIAAREEDDIDAGMSHKAFSSIGRSLKKIDRSRREAGFFKQLDQTLAHGRGIFRRLENYRVAFQQAGS